MKTREPFFNLSEPVPVWTCGVIIIFHILAQILPVNMFNRLAEYFYLAMIEGELITNPSSFLLYALVHGDWGHLFMNCGFIAIFGIVICRSAGKGWRSAGRFLAIFAFATLIGGFTQIIWSGLIGETVSVIGASGGGAGLMAAAAYVLGGKEKLIKWGGVWLIINVLMILAGMLAILPSDIAVAVHLGGYLGGAILSLLLLRPNSTDFRITR